MVPIVNIWQVYGKLFININSFVPIENSRDEITWDSHSQILIELGFKLGYLGFRDKDSWNAMQCRLLQLDDSFRKMV